MSARDVAYSLWLMPSDEDLDPLERLVAELAPLFGMPAFPPHATVQGDLSLRLAAVREVAAQAAQGVGVQRWPVRGIEMSDHVYRTFYVAFDYVSDFLPMLERSAQAAGTRHGLSPFPHLSLAYGTLDPLRKAALAAEFGARLPKTITFDRLVVSISGQSVPIPSWRALESLPLR
jgi:Cyclic phosphodiesterase-like protein